MENKRFLKVLAMSILMFSLTVSASLAEMQTVTKEGVIKVTRYGNGYRFDRNGWIYVHIEGTPYERGFQHGYLVASELEEIMENMKYLTYWNTGKEWKFFVEAGEKLFVSRIDTEFLEEIKGIAEGVQSAGTEITWEEVLAWNGYFELSGTGGLTRKSGNSPAANKRIRTIAAHLLLPDRLPGMGKWLWLTTVGMHMRRGSS